MKRAAILIGVDHTGSLPTLNDAALGAHKMAKWARSQTFDHVKVLTDEDGPVDPTMIKRAVREVVDKGTFDQLLVYFAGHGVNIRYGEYWLLSDAPGDTQAAVNVEGSVVLARYCGIPHVVLISDACRTAADSIRAQFVTGSEIFPNDAPGGTEQSVDLFFACTLGKPALEVRDPTAAAGAFSAVYTDVLHEALTGSIPDVIDFSGGKGFVRPRPLKEKLRPHVSKRLFDLDRSGKLNQLPDGRITSDATAWLAEVDGATTRGGGDWATPPSDSPVPLGPVEATQELVRKIIHRGPSELPIPADPSSLPYIHNMITGEDSDDAPFTNSVSRATKPFGPDRFETGCGFKVQGNMVTGAFSPTAGAEIVSGPGGIVRVYPSDRRADNILLTFRDGIGTVLPAFHGFIGALTFEGQELVGVSYEPAVDSERWAGFAGRADEIRTLRGVIAAAVEFGTFRIDGEDAFELARRMQYMKSMDPAMALYAGYAYHGLQRLDLIREMMGYLKSDLGVGLFDLSLLAGYLRDSRPEVDDDVLPFFPLLSQGWALLSANRVILPASAQGIKRHLLPSLWTLFDATGVDQLRTTLHI